MAAENTTANKNFYRVIDNKFRFSVPAKTETSKQITGENDKIFHFEEYNKISGFLKRFMKWTDESKSDPSKTWEMFAIDLKDSAGNLECLQMYWNDNATTSFLKRLPNIDLTKEVFINLRTDDKGFNRIDVSQFTDAAEGQEPKLEICPFFWNKEKPLPKWEILNPKEVAKGVKAKYSRLEQDELLESLFNLKNAEIVDTIKAIQKDGLTKDQLHYNESEFGKVLNYVSKDTETPEEKHKREVAELDAVAAGKAKGKAGKKVAEDDLPF